MVSDEANKLGSHSQKCRLDTQLKYCQATDGNQNVPLALIPSCKSELSVNGNGLVSLMGISRGTLKKRNWKSYPLLAKGKQVVKVKARVCL